MNVQFQSWFSQGKAVEALCGLGDYFMPDVTYRDEHDFGLAVQELIEWANQSHIQEAARAFEKAVVKLLQRRELKSSLLLMRSYAILRDQKIISLPLNEELLLSNYETAVKTTAQQLSRDEELRNLLLSVSRDFPAFQVAIGISMQR